MSAPDENRSIFEAAAYSAILRASGHVGAAATALTEVGQTLDPANLPNLSRELDKVIELHRLCAARLAGIVRRLGERSAS